MPTWQNDRLQKRGSYCNWESVLAHATAMHNDGQLDDRDFARVHEHLLEIMTYIPDCKRFHYSKLSHFGGELSADDYHKECCLAIEPVTAVKITPYKPNGDAFEVLLTPEADGRYNFEKYLNRPYMLQGPSHTLSRVPNCVRKNMKNREVTMLYWPCNCLMHNQLASSMFKTHICGDVLLVQHTTEASFRPRERFVNYTKQQFDEQFCRKRKARTTAMSATEYSSLKEEMQVSLTEVEAKVAKHSKRPEDLAQGAAMMPPTGKELAGIAKLLGNVPPEKLVRLEERLVAAQEAY